MDKKELAIWLHNNYEEIAQEKNWDTQKSCKVKFDDLPQKNKDTMLEMGNRLHSLLQAVLDKCATMYIIQVREKYGTSPKFKPEIEHTNGNRFEFEEARILKNLFQKYSTSVIYRVKKVIC